MRDRRCAGAPVRSPAVPGQRFSAADLGTIERHWDAAVDRTPDIDRFCTSTLWSFAAATSFPEVGPPVVVGDGSAFCGLRSATTTEGATVLVGLDPIWGFASPAVGAPRAAASMVASRLSIEDFDYAVVAGQRADSALAACIVRALDGSFRLLRGPLQERLQIDLGDGADAWRSRRSGRFRQRLGQLQRRADAAGLEVVDVSALTPDELFPRLLAVEAASWKADEGTGMNANALADFYRQASARLARCDQLRVLLARVDGDDVGYILGGVRGDLYRGMQLSYVRAASDLGVGHLLQLAQIERLQHEGIVTYDMGMDMPYKRRWADRVDETFAIVAVSQGFQTRRRTPPGSSSTAQSRSNVMVEREPGSYTGHSGSAAADGAPSRAKATQASAMARERVRIPSVGGPVKKAAPLASRFSKTKGISTAWAAPRAPSNAVDRKRNSYPYVSACADCASSSPIAGSRKTRSVIAASSTRTASSPISAS